MIEVDGRLTTVGFFKYVAVGWRSGRGNGHGNGGGFVPPVENAPDEEYRKA